MNIETIVLLSLPFTYLAMYVVERFFPAREFPKVPWWGFVGICFMVLTMSVGNYAPLLFPVKWLETHRLMDGTKLGLVGSIVVGFVVVELATYGWHRASHRFSFMWRTFHQMHHGPQRLDIPGSVVFHPLELLAQNAISIGATVFVLGIDPLAAAIVGYLVTFSALFQHWNVNTPRWWAASSSGRSHTASTTSTMCMLTTTPIFR